MTIHSIKLHEAEVVKPFFEKIRCRGLYPKWNEQKKGYALFNGATHIDTNDSYNYTQNGDFSVCSWVRKAEISADYAIAQMHLLSGYTSDWIISGGGALFWMRSKTLGDNTVLNDLNWHHLAFVWDRALERYKGYLDGVCLGESDIVSDYGGIESIKIGVRGDGVTSFWSGSIARVKIFLRKLTDTEIKNIFDMATITYGLGSYYPLIENAKDYSGHNKDGTNHSAVFVRGW